MRIPNLTSLITPSLSGRIAEIREQLSVTSQEAVTGRVSDVTKHLDGQIGKAMLSQKMVDGIARQQSALALRETRLDLTQSSLTQIQTASSSLGTQLQSAIGFEDSTSLELAGRDAESALQQIFSALGTRHGDRYLFSGDATSTPPLQAPDEMLSQLRVIAQASPDAATYSAALETFFNDPAGAWQQGIFSGTPDPSDSDAVTAIDPAITQLVSGLATLALAGSREEIAVLDVGSSALKAAAINITSGETAIVRLRADRGVVQEQIAQKGESLAREEMIFTNAFNNLTARDQYEAATELRDLEASLEASYLLTTRLSNLSLLNYLR
jgi:flagellar hook-associated protein 3 FlgL